jgi:hypothetical protein
MSQRFALVPSFYVNFTNSIPKLGTAVFLYSQVIPEDVNDLIATYRSL